jgi:Domain of unknown function (DUF1931)
MIAHRETNVPTQVAGVAKFERFFRIAAGLDVDKQDLRRYQEFINTKISDLLLRGQTAAKANRRDVIHPFDLPITNGLQERIYAFRDFGEQIDLDPILERLIWQPPLDLAIGAETEARLPTIAGGLSVAMAPILKILDAELKNPQTAHWERLIQIFNLLL